MGSEMCIRDRVSTMQWMNLMENNRRLYNYNFLLKFLLNFDAYMDTPFLCFYYVFYYRNESEAIKTIFENVAPLLDKTVVCC